jgi:hypothetical protein
MKTREAIKTISQEYELIERLNEIEEQVELTEADRELMRRELLDAQYSSEVALSNMADTVAFIESIKAHYKDKIEGIKAKIDRLGKIDEYIHGHILSYLESHELKTLQAEEKKITVCKASPPVVIIEKSEIPDNYIRRVVETKIDKNAIKAALKKGDLVPGAELGEGKKYLRIS